ncbi:hypothetical protein HDV01_005139 [Terramyces sp. JEL0728]|nr:hypothetical protein HDV01_005139 [Terramyces sp. JEL0728]
MNDYSGSKTDDRIDMRSIKPDKQFDGQIRRSSLGGKPGWTKSTSFSQKNIKGGKSSSSGLILDSVVEIGAGDFKDIITISPPEKQNSVHDNTWMDRSIREEMKTKSKWKYLGSLLSMFILCVYIAVYSAISVKDTYQPTNVLHLTVMLFFTMCVVADLTRLVSLTNEEDSSIPTFIFLLFFGIAELCISNTSDSHTILFLWIVWWFSNFIQRGSIRSNTHLITSFVIVIVLYVGTKLYQYNRNYYSPPNLGSEILIGVIGLISLLAMLYFEKSIHRNELNLIAEEAGVKSLIYINLDLQRQLKVAQINPQESDISAPLTRATELLISLQKDEKMDLAIRDDIQLILEILNEDKLFEPEFLKITNDTEVTNFLQDVLQARKNTSIWSPAKNKQTIVKQSPKHIVATQIIQLLDEYTNPFFDVIQLDVVSEGHALFYVGSRIFQDQDFQSLLGTNERVFRHFMGKIENGYERGNTYHNSIHAADVMHCLYYLVTRDALRSKLTTEDIFACVIAAAAHDYMHPGFTNAFLIATKNPLALRYNDQSVLEHFHAASLYEIFQMPEYDILDGLEKDQKLYIREMVISMILATDMAYHFEWLSKFKNKVSTNSLNFDNQNDKKLVLNMALKCSDVNNLTKPPAISRMWTQLIMDEFFKQGDQEKTRSMPISMFMDRISTDIPKCQLGFIDYIVLPLYESWNAYSNEVRGHIDNLLDNKAHWKSMAENGTPVPRIQIPVVQVSPLRFLEHHNSNVLRGATQFSRKTSTYYKETEGNDTIEDRRTSIFEPILPHTVKRMSTDKRNGFLDVGKIVPIVSEHSTASLKNSNSELASKKGQGKSKDGEWLANSAPGERFYGLENFGNTCYSNSVLQALYFCKPFRDCTILYTYPHSAAKSVALENNIDISLLVPNSTNQRVPSTTNMPSKKELDAPLEGSFVGSVQDNSKKSTEIWNGTTMDALVNKLGLDGSQNDTILGALQNLFLSISTQKKQTGVMGPKQFITKLKQENEIFSSTQQQDAHEMFNYLINEIADTLTRQKKELATKLKELDPANIKVQEEPVKTWIHKLFEGQLTNETKCLNCESITNRDEPFLDLSIDIDQHTSLSTCLRQFSKSEVLCHKDKMKIKSLPNVLAIHLKRFKYQEQLGRFSKLSYRVCFTEKLGLFNTADETENPETIYDLTGIIVHIGSNQQWILLDDEDVTPIDESDLAQYFGESNIGTGYLFIYSSTTYSATEMIQQMMPDGWKPPAVETLKHKVSAPHISIDTSSNSQTNFEVEPPTPSILASQECLDDDDLPMSPADAIAKTDSAGNIPSPRLRPRMNMLRPAVQTSVRAPADSKRPSLPLLNVNNVNVPPTSPAPLTASYADETENKESSNTWNWFSKINRPSKTPK